MEHRGLHLCARVRRAQMPFLFERQHWGADTETDMDSTVLPAYSNAYCVTVIGEIRSTVLHDEVRNRL